MASAATAGCSGVLPGDGAGSGDDPAEVIVENGTDSGAEIAVRITDSDGETLFSRVFSVGSEAIESGGSIETTPSRVHAFTADGVSRTWRYDPDLPVGFDCEPKDVGLTLRRENTIEPWYDC